MFKRVMLAVALMASALIGTTAVSAVAPTVAGAASIGSGWSEGEMSVFHWNIDQDCIDLHINIDCYSGTFVVPNCLEFHSDSRFGNIYVFPGHLGSVPFFVDVVNPNTHAVYKNWPYRNSTNQPSGPIVTNANYAFQDADADIEFGSVQQLRQAFLWYDTDGYDTIINQFRETFPLYQLI
jgi:hypothetical protein